MSSIDQYPTSVQETLEIANGARNLVLREMVLQHIDHLTAQIIDLVLQWQGFSRYTILARELKEEVLNDLLDARVVEPVPVPEIVVRDADTPPATPPGQPAVLHSRKSRDLPTRARTMLIRQVRTLLESSLEQASEQIARAIGYVQQGIGKKITALALEKLGRWKDEDFDFSPAVAGAFVAEWAPIPQKPRKVPITKSWEIRPGRYRFIDETIPAVRSEFSIRTDDVSTQLPSPLLEPVEQSAPDLASDDLQVFFAVTDGAAEGSFISDALVAALPTEQSTVVMPAFDDHPFSALPDHTVLTEQHVSELQTATAFISFDSVPLSIHGHDADSRLLPQAEISVVPDRTVSRRTAPLSGLHAADFSVALLHHAEPVVLPGAPVSDAVLPVAESADIPPPTGAPSDSSDQSAPEEVTPFVPSFTEADLPDNPDNRLSQSELYAILVTVVPALSSVTSADSCIELIVRSLRSSVGDAIEVEHIKEVLFAMRDIVHSQFAAEARTYELQDFRSFLTPRIVFVPAAPVPSASAPVSAEVVSVAQSSFFAPLDKPWPTLSPAMQSGIYRLLTEAYQKGILDSGHIYAICELEWPITDVPSHPAHAERVAGGESLVVTHDKSIRQRQAVIDFIHVELGISNTREFSGRHSLPIVSATLEKTTSKVNGYHPPKSIAKIERLSRATLLARAASMAKIDATCNALPVNDITDTSIQYQLMFLCRQHDTPFASSMVREARELL